MIKATILFTSTRETEEVYFDEIPKLTDIFHYKGNYYTVIDYEEKLLHVSRIRKLNIQYKD